MILTIGIILKRFHGRNFSSCQEQKIKILISYIHLGQFIKNASVLNTTNWSLDCSFSIRVLSDILPRTHGSKLGLTGTQISNNTLENQMQ